MSNKKKRKGHNRRNKATYIQVEMLINQLATASALFSVFSIFYVVNVMEGTTNDIYSPPPTPFRLILQSPICHRLPSLFAFEIPAFPAILFPYLGAPFFKLLPLRRFVRCIQLFSYKEKMRTLSFQFDSFWFSLDCSVFLLTDGSYNLVNYSKNFGAVYVWVIKISGY